MRTQPSLEIGKLETDFLLTPTTTTAPFASLGDDEFDDAEEETDDLDLDDEDFDEFGEEGEDLGLDEPDEFGNDEDFFEEGEEMGFDDEEDDDEH